MEPVNSTRTITEPSVQCRSLLNEEVLTPFPSDSCPRFWILRRHLAICFPGTETSFTLSCILWLRIPVMMSNPVSRAYFADRTRPAVN
ncbi:hypothetical protein M3J09_009640 [Ascochyta lentis]